MIIQSFKKLHSLASVLTYLKRPYPTLSIKQTVIVASMMMTGLLLGIRHLGGLQILELAAFDHLVRLQADAGPDPRLLIVGITEDDLQQQQQWPLSDHTLAQVLQKLQKAQAKVIGLDIYRNISHPPGREMLLKELQKPNVVTITNLGDSKAQGVAPISGLPSEQIGFNDFVVDPDGVIRRNFIYAYDGEEKFYSFALRLSLKYLANRGVTLSVTPDALYLGKTRFPAISSDAGSYHNVDSTGYQVLISYRSAENVAQKISLNDILQDKFDPNLVKNKVVLIGTVAPSLKDLFFTPYSASKSTSPGVSGVTLHTQLVSQILSTIVDNRPLFWFWPEWAEILWIWLWALGGGVLVWRLQHPLALGIAGTASLAVLYGICLSIFTYSGWIPLLPPALTFLTTAVCVMAYKQWQIALYDSLTRLPNRSLFIKYLQAAINRSRLGKNNCFALLFLDIDRFKVINESLTHYVGDQFLINFSQRLSSCIGCKGVIARVGGDEFAILLENISETSFANSIADQLQKQMTSPFKINGQEIFTSVSIGIAFNQIQLEHQPEDMLRDAHTAMYLAKDLGKARHEVFAVGMHTQVVRRFQLETDLRRAVLQQEFFLYYQPIVSLENHQIVGFEALLRWKHPQNGFISPVEFIPIAEETGLIIPLGQWILEAACSQLSSWQSQFPQEPPLMMSVNISGQQLSQPDLVEYIQKILQKTGLDGTSLKLEITESVAMKNVETAITIMLQLRTLNIRLSIDDFGTGYSSLSYLHRFPVNTLKIDRSFVSRMGETNEDAAIVRTIIMLSHTLGMNVIAEGVETITQQDQLQLLGCEYGQGYFYSQPLDSEAATKLLKSQCTGKNEEPEMGDGVDFS
ncbi:diguanylate cyclase [Nostoc sp. CMAA1605]|nr:diguanylate cyclase [Nostoc sp. CMAA1605]